jgi:glycosyltransferase involved in cell wall biosynthesis
VPETVRDGVNGLLVAGSDGPAMAAGLRTLLSAPEDAARRAARAARDVEAYAWSRITDAYQDCYDDAGAESQRRSQRARA